MKQERIQIKESAVGVSEGGVNEPMVIKPVSGARVVVGDHDVALFGQPPEVLKALLQHKTPAFNTIVLTDTREKGGSLMSNLEFPIYFFLFFANGYAEGRKMNLVGDEESISQALRLLRYTLTGPTESELDHWGTETGLKREWLDVAASLALKDSDGGIMAVENFFNICPFRDDVVTLDELEIRHVGTDCYEVTGLGDTAVVDLSQDNEIEPAYQVQRDYITGNIVKFGVEILGGASGFSPDEPCTSLAFCHNGEYILIDAMPFLDQHLYARGISKSQISTLFLTHLHDDHCAMFPLMLTPQVVEVVTTREIYNMAMEKLSCGLGWKIETVRKHFKLYEVEVGKVSNYFGLKIEPHATVHSIPTIGATFSMTHHGNDKKICIVGDNHNMSAIHALRDDGVVRPGTVATLEQLYTDRFHMLIADGGEGAIHGDPADAIHSLAERVIYVHVEELTNEFDTNFSLAVAGKRYSVVDGDVALYNSQISHHLSNWLDQPLPERWLTALTTETEIRRYNSDDVIMVQGAETSNYVYLLLTGYCEVKRHDGQRLHTVARLQAGDVIGEMASITGQGHRNASVVSRTPVTVCVFSEETFKAFVESQELASVLQERWSLRGRVTNIPCFAEMTSNVHLQISILANEVSIRSGEERMLGNEGWYLLCDGNLRDQNGNNFSADQDELPEFGWKPFYLGHEEGVTEQVVVTADGDSTLIFFERSRFEDRINRVPQLNYYLRKYRGERSNRKVDWHLGPVEIR